MASGGHKHAIYSVTHVLSNGCVLFAPIPAAPFLSKLPPSPTQSRVSADFAVPEAKLPAGGEEKLGRRLSSHRNSKKGKETGVPPTHKQRNKAMTI